MLLIFNQITNDVFISNETKIKTLKIENKILIDICNKESLNTIISDLGEVFLITLNKNYHILML